MPRKSSQSAVARWTSCSDSPYAAQMTPVLDVRYGL
eukprot:COSAG02_NODE_17758_length_983_cov_1.246606_1_plen_35_part_10